MPYSALSSALGPFRALASPTPFNLDGIFAGAVAVDPRLIGSVTINLAVQQPLDLVEPSPKHKLALVLETQNSTHDTLRLYANATTLSPSPLRPPASLPARSGS